MIYVYDRDESGMLSVHEMFEMNDGGWSRCPVGDQIRLRGWPTPFMRPMAHTNGEETIFFVGTFDNGEMAEVGRCVHCRGTGSLDPDWPFFDTTPCEYCGGTGKDK